MTHLPWMPVYVGDELAETSHLNAEEYGAYALLKMHLWQHGRLPSDDERLARIAKCGPDQWLVVRDAIWSLFADDWRHPRLESLRAQSEETHKKRSEAGRRGGRPRLEEKPGLSRDKAGPKHPQPQPQPQSDSYSEAQAQSQGSAAEKDQGGTYTRALPAPHSIDEGKLFLLGRGCPPEEMKRCLGMLMDGHLTPFDMESWDVKARANA